MIVSRALGPAAEAAELAIDSGGGERAADPGGGELAPGSSGGCAGTTGRWSLPGAPWSLRLARGPGNRTAVEIYENGRLLDVMVATPLAADVLRGARRARRGGQYRALAWGRLLSDGAAVSVTFRRVTFRRGRIRTASSVGTVTEVGTWFWIAVAEGNFGRVSVGYRCAARCSPAGS